MTQKGIPYLHSGPLLIKKAIENYIVNKITKEIKLNCLELLISFFEVIFLKVMFKRSYGFFLFQTIWHIIPYFRA